MKFKTKKTVQAEQYEKTGFAEGTFDEAQSLWHFEESGQAYWGFGFELSATRKFRQHYFHALDALFSSLPTESVVQFAVHVDTGAPERELDEWAQSRVSEKYREIADCAESRRNFLKALAREHVPDWAKDTRLRLRSVRHFVFIKVPLSTALVENGEKHRYDVASILENCCTRLARSERTSRLLSKVDYENLEQSLRGAVITAEGRSNRKPTKLGPDLHKQGVMRAALPLVATCHPQKPWTFGGVLDSGVAMQSTPVVDCPHWAFTIFHIKTRVAMTEALSQSHHKRYRGIFPSSGKNITGTSEWWKSRNTFLAQPEDRDILVSAGIVMFSRPDDADENIERGLAAGRRAGYRMSHLHAPRRQSLTYWKPFESRWEVSSPAPWVTMVDYEGKPLAEFADDANQAPLSSGGVPLVTPRGSLSAFNPWRSPSNFNFVLAGLAGCGKSIFSREVMAGVLAEGGRVQVIAYDQDWLAETPAAESLRPELVTLEENTPFSLNPFSALTTEEDFWSSFKAIVELIVAMAYPVMQKKEIPPHVEMLAGHAVAAAWKKKREATSLREVRNCLRCSELRQGVDLADLLEPFVTGGYAGWFEGPRDRYESSDFVAYMMATHRWHSNRQEGLHEALSCALTLAVYQDAMSGAGRPKQLVYVGALELLPAYGRGAAFEAMLRKGAGLNLGVGTECRGLEDLHLSIAGRLALEQSATLALMYQKKESVDYAQHMRLLDENSAELVKTVHSGRQSAGVFVRNGFGQEGVYRFIADPLTLAAFSDDWRNRGAYRDARGAGASVEEALRGAAARDYRSQKLEEQSAH